jgi:hypothetical protein
MELKRKNTAPTATANNTQKEMRIPFVTFEAIYLSPKTQFGNKGNNFYQHTQKMKIYFPGQEKKFSWAEK